MEDTIKMIINSFVEAGTNRDIKILHNVLHKDFRVMANRFKGAPGTTLLSKDDYLDMMKTEKIGGTKYDVNIIHTSIKDHISNAEIYCKSASSSDMHLYLFLVRDDDDQWKIISDLPIIIE